MINTYPRQKKVARFILVKRRLQINICKVHSKLNLLFNVGHFQHPCCRIVPIWDFGNSRYRLHMDITSV
jgi:hypothetical protein